MAINMLQLRADLLRIQEADLIQVRAVVDEALLVRPPDRLANQEAQNVFNALKKDRNAAVRCLIESQPSPGVFTTITQVYDPAVHDVNAGFMTAVKWLYEFFNARK